MTHTYRLPLGGVIRIPDIADQARDLEYMAAHPPRRRSLLAAFRRRLGR